MKVSYFSIDKVYKGDLLKEKGSKFYSYIFPVTSEKEIRIFLDDIKKDHPKARHWCYAWSIGVDDIVYRVNDDGEPSNSAGQPIYGQLLSAELNNVLIVVVRYFGGVKLGVGGLISAYRESAKLAISASVIVEKTVNILFELQFLYQDLNKIMKIVKIHKLKIKAQSFDVDCSLILSVKKSDSNKIENLLKQLRCVTICQTLE